MIALVTLTFLEIVLGVDNVIFISILSGKLPADQQPKARQIGLLAAMGMRILLLFSIAWIVRLTAPLFTVAGQEISGRDLILLCGGLFLLAKATLEIHERLEGEEGHGSAKVPPSLGAVIFQIMLLDIVFSLDSVITAVGHGRRPLDHGGGGDRLGRHHDVLGGADQRLRLASPDGEGAGAVVPAADRRSRWSARASTCTSRRATSTSRWDSRCSSR